MSGDIRVVRLNQDGLAALFRRVVLPPDEQARTPTQTPDIDSNFPCHASVIDSVVAEQPTPQETAAAGGTTHQQLASYQIEAKNVSVDATAPIPDIVEDGSRPPSSQGVSNVIDEKITVGDTAKDEFRWRKYGQKLVKGSEFPRSYYKCSIKMCPAKKYTEQFIDSIDAIVKFRTIYLDRHQHPIQEAEKVLVDSAKTFVSLVANNFSAFKPKDGCINPDHVVAEMMQLVEGAGSEAAQPNKRGQEKKQRAASKKKSDASSEKLVIRLAHLVDPNADGYPWRKYGRKSIKGSDVPREYYRCSRTDCPVKKQIEPHADGSHTVTYEGKHNHELSTEFLERRGPSSRPKLESEATQVLVHAQRPKDTPEPTSSVTKKRKNAPTIAEPSSKRRMTNDLPTLDKTPTEVILQGQSDASRMTLAALSSIFQNSDVADALQQFDEYADVASLRRHDFT